MLTTLSIFSLDQGKLTSSERRRIEGEGEAGPWIDDLPMTLPMHALATLGGAGILDLVMAAVARPKPAGRHADRDCDVIAGGANG